MNNDSESSAEKPAQSRRSHKKGRHSHPHSHAREVVLQALYQYEVVNYPLEEILKFKWLNEKLDPKKEEFCRSKLDGISRDWEALDNVIRSFSDKDFTQISIVVRCILRLAIYELMEASLDARIVMDDIVKLTRKYDGESSVAFVNGIIDRFEKERLEELTDDK